VGRIAWIDHPVKKKRGTSASSVVRTLKKQNARSVMPSKPNDATSRNWPVFPAPVSHAGQLILAANTNAAEVAILRRGAAAIVKEAIEIVRASDPSAAFGELSVLPDETANLPAFCDTAVRTQRSPVPLIYVATILVRRPVGAQTVDQVINQAGIRVPRPAITKTIDGSEEQLAASSGNLVYAGYPYDPFK